MIVLTIGKSTIWPRLNICKSHRIFVARLDLSGYYRSVSNMECSPAKRILEKTEEVAAVRDTIPQVAKRPRIETLTLQTEQETHNATLSNKKKHRSTEKGKDGRKNFRRNRNEEDTNRVQDGTLVNEDCPKAPRLPKRQCGLLIGFCGSGYSGMQIQPSHTSTRTIEGVLFNALVKVGAVSQDNADNPVKVSLARAARTDAGVHAAGNLVSLKMIMTVPGVPDLVARINEELPPEIRLWGYVRTQNSFNARLVCNSRKYTYFFPSYLLIPPKPGSGLHRVLNTMPTDFWRQEESSFEVELLRKRAWRVDQEPMKNLRNIAQKFLGTHNFHNFTVDRDFTDRSNHRFMKNVEIADPVVYGETEWISVLFHGQSFMLHQIRKMMAGLVLACRTGAPEQLIDEMYGPRTVFVPKMPALGLLLEEPLFESYNERVLTINEKLQPSDADYRPPICFEHHRDEIVLFKEQYIYKNMREIEDRDGLFDAWIRGVDSYAGNDLLYLNPTGKIPTAAVIKKKERRENPFREKRLFDATSFPTNRGIQKLQEELEQDEEEMEISIKNLAETEG